MAYPWATSSIMLTTSRAAFGRARLRAAHDWRSISPGWSRREKISVLRRSGESSGSGITRPAPARAISWALRNWWLSVACPKGTKIAARPEAAISAAVMAPARQTTRSAQAKRSAMFVRKGTTSAAYSRRAYAAEVVPFLTNMAERFAWADLVVCRAGAITAAEIAASGRAAIFVPFGHATDSHQLRNAQEMARAGAGRVIPEPELSPE